MSEKKNLNIGLIGYGFMGRTHSNGYKRVSDFFPDLQHRPVLKAVCGRTEDRTKAFAEQWGYENFETDWRELIKREDIDAIDICTPNDQHAEVAIAAAEAGELNLLTGIVYGEGDRRIAGQARHDLSQQPGRQCDGPAGFHTGGEGRLNSQAQVKTGQAEAVAACIGGEQDIGQNRVRGACGDCTAHQLQSAIQFGLRTDHLHRPDDLIALRCPTVSQAEGKCNGQHVGSLCSAVWFLWI